MQSEMKLNLLILSFLGAASEQTLQCFNQADHMILANENFLEQTVFPPVQKADFDFEAFRKANPGVLFGLSSGCSDCFSHVIKCELDSKKCSGTRLKKNAYLTDDCRKYRESTCLTPFRQCAGLYTFQTGTSVRLAPLMASFYSPALAFFNNVHLEELKGQADNVRQFSLAGDTKTQLNRWAFYDFLDANHNISQEVTFADLQKQANKLAVSMIPLAIALRFIIWIVKHFSAQRREHEALKQGLLPPSRHSTAASTHAHQLTAPGQRHGGALPPRPACAKDFSPAAAIALMDLPQAYLTDPSYVDRLIVAGPTTTAAVAAKVPPPSAGGAQRTPPTYPAEDGGQDLDAAVADLKGAIVAASRKSTAAHTNAATLSGRR